MFLNSLSLYVALGLFAGGGGRGGGKCFIFFLLFPKAAGKRTMGALKRVKGGGWALETRGRRRKGEGRPKIVTNGGGSWNGAFFCGVKKGVPYVHCRVSDSF